MNLNLPNGYDNRLIWWPELGMGFHPQEPMDYDGDYWEKYLEYDKTEMGAALTKARVELVQRHTDTGEIVDIGIGGGLFVRTMDCFGYDVNKKANAWLMEEGRFKSPYTRSVKAITCWDAIEHVPDPITLINNVDEWFFASIPVFQNGDSVTSSKHYRPGEHIWYWTHAGFINFMYHCGFKMVECNLEETKLGREDINSYAFKRVSHPLDKRK